MILHPSTRIVPGRGNVGSGLRARSADIHPRVIAGLDPAIHLHAKKDGPAGQARG